MSQYHTTFQGVGILEHGVCFSKSVKMNGMRNKFVVWLTFALKDPNGTILANDVTFDVALQLFGIKCSWDACVDSPQRMPWVSSWLRSGASGTDQHHNNATITAAARDAKCQSLPVLQHNQDVYSA